MKRADNLLAAAIERKDWEAAAVVIIAGAHDITRLLPPDVIEQMIELLAEDPPQRHARKGRGRGQR